MRTLVLFLSLTTTACFGQKPAFAEKWWAFYFINGSDNAGDTIQMKPVQEEMINGIFFKANGEYTKAKGKKFCGTYVEKHHPASNPTRYENGRWNFSGNTLEMICGDRIKKYRLISPGEKDLVLIAI